ncbi:MAG: group 1 truncated hemoglobin [Alphaproteobacteria bacterium]|nr:group 1 truncated hemoglobin [Alphaproteobacteria bacterium]
MRTLARTLALLAIVALAGCAGQSEPALYQRLGGTPGIAAVVDDFVDNVRFDPVIGKRFEGVDIDHTKAMLTELVCKASGGPCAYTGRSMKDTHRGMDISDAEFNAMAADMAKTLDKFKLPQRERGEVLALLNSMRGDVVGQ